MPDSKFANSSGSPPHLRLAESFVKLVESKDDEQLEAWLHECLSTRQVPGLVVSSKLEVPSLLRLGAQYLPPNQTDRLRRAIVRLTIEYDTVLSGGDYLQELILSIAYLRVSHALPGLRSLVTTGMLEAAASENDILQIVSSIIAVIHGFLPDSWASTAMEDLFYSDALPRELTPQVFVAVVEANPDQFPARVPRFLHRLPSDATTRQYTALRQRFVQIVSFERLRENWARVDETCQRDFVTWLAEGSGAPLEIMWDQESEEKRLVPKGDFVTLGIPIYLDPIELINTFTPELADPVEYLRSTLVATFPDDRTQAGHNEAT